LPLGNRYTNNGQFIVHKLRETLDVPLSQYNSEWCTDVLQLAYKFAFSNCAMEFTLKI